MDGKKIKLKKLTPLYLFIFTLTILLVAPSHLSEPPLFMPLRFPHYLEKMEPFLGLSWPLTFEIYHLALLILAIIFSINILGLTFYSKWGKIAKFSSFIGILITTPMVLFFFLQFINVNFTTAVIYGFYCVTLLIVDFVTFKVLTRQKEA